jgi:group I intron endonuclease
MSSISRTPSIYQIRHIESGKVYVGSAVDPRRRKSDHFKCLRKGAHHSRHLQRAWNKYGEDAFVFEIIEPVLFVEDLIIREQYWIDTLRAADRKHGFNICLTAGSALGTKRSNETLLLQSEVTKARWNDPAFRAKVSEQAKARGADPTVRKQLTEQSRAYFADPAARVKASDRMKEWCADPAERERMSERTKAQFADPSARAKAAERTRKQFADPGFRERHAEIMRARNANPEYRAKVAASQRARRLREKQG